MLLLWKEQTAPQQWADIAKKDKFMEFQELECVLLRCKRFHQDRVHWLLCCAHWEVFLANISHPFLNSEQMTEKYMLALGKSWSSTAEMFPPSPQNEFQWHFCQKEFLRPRVVSAVGTRGRITEIQTLSWHQACRGLLLRVLKKWAWNLFAYPFKHFIPFQFHNCRISWFCSAGNQSWTSKSWSSLWSYESVNDTLSRDMTVLCLCS